MHDTPEPPKGKPESSKNILPFFLSPEEELAAARKEMAAMRERTAYLEGALATLTAMVAAREGNSSAKEPEPVPTQKEEPRRLKDLRLLYLVMSDIEGLAGTFYKVSGDPMYRIYFVDGSYLWYDDHGRLYAKPGQAAGAVESYNLKERI